MFRTWTVIYSSVDLWLVSKAYCWWKNCYSSFIAFARRNMNESLIYFWRIFVRQEHIPYCCILFPRWRQSVSTNRRFVSDDSYFAVLLYFCPCICLLNIWWFKFKKCFYHINTSEKLNLEFYFSLHLLCFFPFLTLFFQLDVLDISSNFLLLQ